MPTVDEQTDGRRRRAEFVRDGERVVAVERDAALRMQQLELEHCAAVRERLVARWLQAVHTLTSHFTLNYLHVLDSTAQARSRNHNYSYVKN